MLPRRALLSLSALLIGGLLIGCSALATPAPPTEPTSEVPFETATVSLTPIETAAPASEPVPVLRVYYARPIFTPAEQAYNSSVERMMEDAGFSLPRWGSSSGKTRAQRIFDGCFAGIVPANALLAILTGTEVDDGTASEIGIFYAMMQTDCTKKGIVAMHDDWRTNPEHTSFQGKGLNDFVLGCVLRGGSVVRSADAAVQQLALWEDELASKGLLGVDPDASEALSETEARPLGLGEDGTPTMKVYLAGPQHTPYARQYMEGLAQRLRELGVDVFVPALRYATEDPRPAPEEVFDHDYRELQSANVLVALLDGTQIDDATALELGLFYGLSLSDPSKKGIVGFITDVRGLRWRDNGFGCNHFPVGLIEYSGGICDDFEDVIRQVQAWREELTAGG